MFRALVCGAVASLLLFGWAAGPVSAADAVAFGCVLSLSGPRERTGKLYRKAYDLAADWINSHGGVKVGGRSLEMRVTYLDSGGEERAIPGLVEKLVSREGAGFLLGPFSSAEVLAAGACAERLGVPMIHAGGAAREIRERGFKRVFGLLPSPAGYLVPVAEAAAATRPRTSRAALIWADDKFDREAAAGFREAAARSGLDLALDERYEPGTRDFSGVLERLGAAAPQLIVLAGYPEDARLLIGGLRRKGPASGMIALASGLGDRTFLKAMGPEAEGLCGVSHWDKGMDFRGAVFGSTAEFVRLYRERYAEEPDYHAAAAAAVLAVFREAIEKAGVLDRDRVAEAIAAVDVDTVYGRVAFGPDGFIRGGRYLLQVRGGRPVPWK